MEAKVVKVNDGEGHGCSYLTRVLAADRGNKRLEEAFENQEVLTAKVAQVLDGGLSVDRGRSKNLYPGKPCIRRTMRKIYPNMLVQEIEFVITEFNPRRRRVIGDRKQLIRC